MAKSSALAPVGSYLLRPDTRVTLTERWYQLLTPSLQDVDLNEVIISHMEKDEVERKIQQVFAEYREYNLPFNWVTAPNMCTPTDFGQRISPLAEIQWGFRGMVCPVDLSFGVPDEVTTELVGLHNFDELLKVTGGHEGARLALSLRPGSPYLHFLAKIGGRLAGMAGLVLKPGHGYLVSSSTVPEMRGRGVYRSLVRARLEYLKQLGLSHAVTQAREATSVPILEKLGFHTTFRGVVYQFAAGS